MQRQYQSVDNDVAVVATVSISSSRHQGVNVKRAGQTRRVFGHKPSTFRLAQTLATDEVATFAISRTKQRS